MNHETIFESERINYIKVSEDYINDYLNMINDVNIQKCVSHNPKTYTLEAEKEWIKHQLDSNAFTFSMIEKATGSFIGNISITIRNNIGLLGISITPEKQNYHYGQESIKRIIVYALANLNIDNIELDVFKHNERAINCYEKVGFVSQSESAEEIHMIYKTK